MKRHLPFLLHSNGVIRFILRVHLSDELSLQSLRRLMFHLWNTQNRNLLKECVFSTVFFFLQLYFISLSSSCRLNQGRTKRVSSENQKWQLWLPGRTGCRGHSPCLAEWAISQLPADETPLCREIQFPRHRLHWVDSVLLLVECQSNTSSNKKAAPLIKTTYSILTYAKENKYLNKHGFDKGCRD